MEKYNYIEAVKDDVLDWIDENLSLAEWEDEQKLLEHLEDVLFAADSVTGNGSGSYTFNTYTAEEYIAHNWDIIGEMIDEGYILINQFRDGPEVIDVCIRCYVLGAAIEEALFELREDKNSNYNPIERDSDPLEGEIVEFHNHDLRINFSLNQINECYEEWNMVFMHIATLLDRLDCSFIGEPYSVGNFSMAQTIYNAYSGTYYTLIYSEINDTLLENKPLYLSAREGSEDDLIQLIGNNGCATWSINDDIYHIIVIISDELISYNMRTIRESETIKKDEIPRNGMDIIEARNLILEQLGFDLQQITLRLTHYIYG